MPRITLPEDRVAMRFSTHVDHETNANIAPLLDVVLLLLIFFMVTTSFAEKQIALDLPQAETGTRTNDEFLVLSIDRDGVYSTSEGTLDLEQLGDLLKDLARKDQNLEVRADAATRHRDVVRVLDLARRFNLLHVGIAVDTAKNSATRQAPLP